MRICTCRYATVSFSSVCSSTHTHTAACPCALRLGAAKLYLGRCLLSKCCSPHL
jgi:hypothetical protein